MDIRIRIRAMMDERGLTTYALAQKSGLSVACITNWQERGYEPSLKALTKISEAFGISLAELFCENDSEMVPIGEDKRRLLNLWDRLDEEERNIRIYLRWITNGRLWEIQTKLRQNYLPKSMLI